MNNKPIGKINVFGKEHDYYGIVNYDNNIHYIIKPKKCYVLVDKLFTLMRECEQFETRLGLCQIYHHYCGSIKKIMYGEYKILYKDIKNYI